MWQTGRASPFINWLSSQLFGDKLECWWQWLARSCKSPLLWLPFHYFLFTIQPWESAASVWMQDWTKSSYIKATESQITRNNKSWWAPFIIQQLYWTQHSQDDSAFFNCCDNRLLLIHHTHTNGLLLALDLHTFYFQITILT